jgi:hypothetical protein
MISPNLLAVIPCLLLFTESSGFAPTAIQVPHDVHEWFTESLHEAEIGEIKIASAGGGSDDDSWIGQEFHSVSPATLFLGRSRPIVETPVTSVRRGNEWMTHALQWDVSAPTASQARAAGVGFPQTGRSDGFVEEEASTTQKMPRTTNLVGLPTGRSDWFGTTSTMTSPSPADQHVTQEPRSASLAIMSQGSADWFHQVLLQPVDQ